MHKDIIFNCSDYSRYNKRDKRCLKCKYKRYCIDARDPSPLWELKSVKWKRKNMAYFQTSTPDPYQLIIKRRSETMKERLLSSLSTCLLEIQQIREKTPKYYRIIMCKLTGWDKSYNNIAKECNCSKQNVHQAIKISIKKWPSLRAAILVNQKYYPKTKKRIGVGSTRKPSYKELNPMANASRGG